MPVKKSPKPKKSDPVSVRFDFDVKDAIDARAAAEDRSIPYIVNRICRDALLPGTKAKSK